MPGLKKQVEQKKKLILKKAKEPIRTSDICVTCHTSFKWCNSKNGQCWWCKTGMPNIPTQIVVKKNTETRKKENGTEEDVTEETTTTDLIAQRNNQAPVTTTRVRNKTRNAR